jgi:hypothetical protein
MNRKIFGNVLATAFLAGALAACSSSSSEQTEEEQAKAEQAEAQEQEQEQDKGDDRTSTSAWWGDNLAGYWYVLKRDMKQLYQSIDRHVFNYDWEDPYLN